MLLFMGVPWVVTPSMLPVWGNPGSGGIGEVRSSRVHKGGKWGIGDLEGFVELGVLQFVGRLVLP